MDTHIGITSKFYFVTMNLEIQLEIDIKLRQGTAFTPLAMFCPPGSQSFSSCVSENGEGFSCSTQTGEWAQCNAEKCPMIGEFEFKIRCCLW